MHQEYKRTSKYIRQKSLILKGEKDKSRDILGGISIPLSVKIQKKISEEIQDVNNSVNQLDLSNIYIYRIFYPNNRIHILLKNVCNIHQNRTYSKLQTYFKIQKTFEIIYNKFCDHNEIKLEINKRNMYFICPNIWKLDIIDLNKI